MAESPLEQAVSEAAGGSGQARRRVYELLAQNALYVDAPKPSGEPGDPVKLSTTTRSGRREMSVFTSIECALAYNPDEDAYRVHAPASWIFFEARRLECAVAWIDSPRFEIPSADFAALAQGLVPGEPPKAAPAQTQTPPASVPPPFVPRASPPPEDGPAVLSPSGRIPGAAQYYLSGSLLAMPIILAAYFFDLVMPGEPRMLCLGLRLDLPTEQWNSFIDAIDQLDEIPGFPDGVAVYPLNGEQLETAREVGVKILDRL